MDLPGRRAGTGWSVGFLGFSIWAAYASKHDWSPLLFLWGVGLAVVATVWKFSLWRAAAGALIKRTSGERRDGIVAWRRNVWRRCVDEPLYGLAAGILAAGTGWWWMIAAATALWIVVGAIAPVFILARKLRRFQDDEEPVRST